MYLGLIMGTKETYENFIKDNNPLCSMKSRKKYIFKIKKNNEEFYYCHYDYVHLKEELKLSFIYGDTYKKVANVIGNSVPLGRLK